MQNIESVYQLLYTDDSANWDLANQILIGLRISKSHRLAILARGWARRKYARIYGGKNKIGIDIELRNLINFISKNPIKNIEKHLMYGEGELYLGRNKWQKHSIDYNYVYANEYIMWLLKTINYIK